MRVGSRGSRQAGKETHPHIWWQVEESGDRDVLHTGLGGLGCACLLASVACGSALDVLVNCPLALGLISDVADLSPGRESVQVEEANSPSIDGHHHYHQADDIDTQASLHLRDKSQKTLVILSQQ